MRVCDKCKGEKCGNVSVRFVKAGITNDPKKEKVALNVPFDLCEKCLTQFMKAFGHWLVSYRRGDAAEGEAMSSYEKDAVVRLIEEYGDGDSEAGISKNLFEQKYGTHPHLAAAVKQLLGMNAKEEKDEGL